MNQEKAKKTILVTGAAGFIGSHVVDRLIDAGHTVVALDDFNPYYSPAFKEANIRHHAGNKRFVFYGEDVTDMNALEKVFRNHHIDAIIHLAARAGVRASIDNPTLYARVNIDGTLNMLEEARKYRIMRFVSASSSSVYGDRKSGPFSENDSTDTPVSLYAATKKSAEVIAYVYHKLYGLEIALLRFFTVYGERGRPDMAPYLFTKALFEDAPIKRFGDGTSKRDYTYVGDVADAVVRSIDAPLAYEIINVGDNNPITLNEFIGTLEEMTGKKARIEELPSQSGDVSVTYADISKAKRILGWEPKTSFREGIEKFVEWYKKTRL